MNSNNIFILSLCVLMLLVISGCTYEKISESTIDNVSNSDEEKLDADCNNHYLTKFGVSINDSFIENADCKWSPNDRYGVVDSSFNAQIKDISNNEYDLSYKKGCCNRHAYAGSNVCIMSHNGETDLFLQMKSEICSKLNNDFDDFTTQCENGKFEKKFGNSIILSLKNDYVNGASSDVKSIYIESTNCLI